MTAVEIIAGILAEHSTFAWNRATTRIRCRAERCGAVMDASGDADAIIMFARHQAGQLPAAAPVAATVESDPSPILEPAEPQATETEGHLMEATLSEKPLAEPDVSPPAQTEPEQIETEEPVEESAGTPAPGAPAKKVRRDTKALTATIAELNKGDRVMAVFTTPRYGQFSLEGTVIKGGAGLDRNQLIVGGWYINLNDRAAKHLQELTIVATAGNHEFDIPKPSEATEHVGIGG